MKTHGQSNIIGSMLMLGRIVLGGIFIYASWDKILDPAAFAIVVANYQILPPALGNVAALGLPWLELVCGICLVINRWARGSALIAAILMVVFMVALGVSSYRGIDIACGCFTMTGEAPQNIWVYLVRDAVLLALATAIFVLPGGRATFLSTLRPKTTHRDTNHHVI